MRTHAPADVETVLARLLEEPSLARGVLRHFVDPAREAVPGGVGLAERPWERQAKLVGGAAELGAATAVRATVPVAR